MKTHDRGDNSILPSSCVFKAGTTRYKIYQKYFVIILYPTTRYIITIPEMYRSFTSLTKEQITQNFP